MAKTITLTFKCDEAVAMQLRHYAEVCETTLTETIIGSIKLGAKRWADKRLAELKVKSETVLPVIPAE